MTRRPDADRVDAAAVAEFLIWYRGRVDWFPTYTGVEFHWLHALWTLDMAELRRGAKEIAERGKPCPYVPPVAFWYLCKGTQTPRSWKRLGSRYERRKNDVVPVS